MEHGPALVELSADGTATAWISCLCGAVGGLHGWQIVSKETRPDGEYVNLSPSCNFHEHFHTPSPTGPIKVGVVITER